MTRSTANNRFRTRKLSTKQTLSVLRENQIDSVDDDAQRNIPQIETGVERQEEIEHHLQAAISAAHATAVGAKNTKKIFIPTPNTTLVAPLQYEKLYEKKFVQPSSYIRFSSSVEDCNGTSYCMSPADDKFLAKLNSTVSKPSSPITDDEFEAIFDLYESIIQLRQPFLSMDVSNLLPYEELETGFDDSLGAHLKNAAKLLYPHWKEVKIQRGGRSLLPTLKFEQHGSDKDDGDPYVCFRRREVRQVRKTRRTDAQSSDKLKRIRQELETARGLVKDILQRETMRKNQIEYERQIFEKRRIIIDLKRKLNIRGDDEDLINKPRRTRAEQATAAHIRLPLRQDGKPPEVDLRYLHQILSEDEKRRMEKFHQLKRSRPPGKYPVMDISDPMLSQSSLKNMAVLNNFCGVQTYYVSESSPSEDAADDFNSGQNNSNLTNPHVSIVQASPRKGIFSRIPTCRRRAGRGGRVMLDRRYPIGYRPKDIDPLVLDRSKYEDNGDDHHTECPAYKLNPHSDEQLLFRSRLLSVPNEAQIQMQRRVLMGIAPVVPGSLSQPNGQSHYAGPVSHINQAMSRQAINASSTTGAHNPYNR